jgi:hypothetical protein
VSVRYLSCGDTSFSVEFGNEISPEINGRVMALHAAIGQATKAGQIAGVVETVPSMRALMVCYDHPEPRDPSIVATDTTYGQTFPSAVWKDNIYATQFHPEKSQRVGLQLLKNFATLAE